MVELCQDKTNQCSRLIAQQERYAFRVLLRQLNLAEPPRSLDSLKFSWDNHRWDTTRSMARLDRYYTFKPESHTASVRVVYRDEMTVT
jgi:hypothetical protein